VQIVTSGDSSSGFSLMVNLKSGKDPLAAPFEFHQWSFELNGRSLTYSSKDGSGALNVGSQIRPYGEINLRLHRVSTVATECGRGNGTSKADSVTVAGTMAFNTQTRAWGRTGQPRSTFSFASGSSIRYQDCSRVPTAPAPQCLSGYVWGSPGELVYDKKTLVSVQNFVGGALDFGVEPDSSAGHPWQGIVARRHVTLSRPAGASRLDEAIETEPPPTALGRNLNIQTTNVGLITGQTDITSTGKVQSLGTNICTHDGRNFHQKTSGYLAGSWKNAKQHPLVGHLAIGDNITVKDGTGTLVYKQSFK
jgi:hypothetical protein